MHLNDVCHFITHCQISLQGMVLIMFLGHTLLDLEEILVDLQLL